MHHRFGEAQCNDKDDAHGIYVESIVRCSLCVFINKVDVLESRVLSGNELTPCDQPEERIQYHSGVTTDNVLVRDKLLGWYS